MKKILYVINNLKIGGIQNALINMLEEISNEHEIDLLIFDLNETAKDLLPKRVNILKSNRYLSLLGQTQKEVKKRSKLLWIIRIVLVLFSKAFGASIPRRVLFSTYSLKKTYDFAISYSQDINDKTLSVGCNDFVIKKVKAKNKLSFIHCDFLNYGGNTKKNRKKYSFFDKIICVSYGCKNQFLKACPNYSDKTYVVYNFVNKNKILSLSEIDTKYYDNRFLNVIIVSRLSKEKGIDRFIEVVLKMVKDGFTEIVCHIVGDGPMYYHISKYIIDNNLSSNIILYGSDKNPYRFIKNADLLVLPSFHECAPLVFNEAMVLKVPILTTKTISAIEMVAENKIGVVCENSKEGLLVEMVNLYNKKYIFNNMNYSNGLLIDNNLQKEQFKKVINN